MNREVDAVTAACLAIRARVFDDVGGLFEGFPLNYNDIDLCLKVRSLGLSVVHVGEPLGHHFESRTREPVILPEEVSLFHSRWPTRPLESDYSFELFG
jgi:GT2 family glycosyltransferase